MDARERAQWYMAQKNPAFDKLGKQPVRESRMWVTTEDTKRFGRWSDSRNVDLAGFYLTMGAMALILAFWIYVGVSCRCVGIYVGVS